MRSTRSRSERLTQGLLLVLGVLGACTEPPEPAWRLDRPRALGAQVSAAGEPARSSLAAGERARVDFVTASRDVARGAFASHALRVCPVDSNASNFECRGPDLRFDESAGPGTTDPSVTFDAPAAPGQVIVFGILCVTGAARLDGATLAGSCAEGAGQELAIRIDVGGPRNARPAFDEASARIDATALVERDDCMGGSIRADGGTHALSIRLAPGALEEGDDLVLSQLATHGELDRLYSTPDASGTFRVDWDAPSSIGAERETARFHFVLRDGRGGTTFLTRSVCLSKGA